MASFYKTSDSFKQGSTTLPQRYYIEDLLLKQEMENIFFNSWLCIGRSNEISKSGEYKIITIGNESLFIIRNEDNKLKAFYNIANHYMVDNRLVVNISHLSIIGGSCLTDNNIEIPNNKSPGETALYWPPRKTLILGDALIGDPPGELRLLPKEKYADAQRAIEGIKVLLNLDFDILLVGDGDSILSGAKSTVEDFIHSN